MRTVKIVFFCIVILVLTSSCASRYQMIEPESVEFFSKSEVDNVTLEYKYNLLNRKYAKKEERRGVKLVAVKIINNSNRDLIFRKDIKLVYEGGREVPIIGNEILFQDLKQNSATYLLYLLLTPLRLSSAENGQETFSAPIGLAIGPGLAVGNMLVATSANNNLRSEMLKYDISGALIKKGETKYGLIGIASHSYEHIKLRIE